MTLPPGPCAQTAKGHGTPATSASHQVAVLAITTMMKDMHTLTRERKKGKAMAVAVQWWHIKGVATPPSSSACEPKIRESKIKSKKWVTKLNNGQKKPLRKKSNREENPR
jgi:hypothetical protein